MAFLTVTVAGVNRSGYLCAHTAGDAATFEEALRERKRFSLEFVARIGLWFPERGQHVTIEHSDSGLLFGGYISTATRRKAPGSVALYTKCTCVSYEQIMDRRLSIARSWTGQLAGGIFNEIVADSLIDEGFTTEFVAGPTIPFFEILEPRPTTREALDKLCELASVGGDIYYWDVSPGKVARFFRQDTYPAPFEITDANPYILVTPTVDETNQGIVNRVFVFLGQFLLDEATETFPGDGTERTFELDYPVGQMPAITVDTGSGPVEQTLGIDGVDTGKQWYWGISSNRIRQDDAETVLEATDTLAVTYRGLDRRSVGPFDHAASASAEGVLQGDGTGVYEQFLELGRIGTAEDAETLAQAWLDRYHRATITFKGSTYRAGLRAGQELSINLSIPGINLSMLIQSVTMVDVGAGQFLWTFTAIQGAARDDWKRALLGQKPSSSISGVGSSGGSVGPEGPPPGAPTPPGEFTIGTLTSRWVNSDVEGSVSVVAEVLIPVTPPTPFGTIKGGHIYVELQDQSSAPPFRLGVSGLGGTDQAVGNWDLWDMGQFPYKATEQPWVLRVTDISPRRTTVVRVYVEPYSEQIDDAPIRAGETNATPSATVTIPPYQAGKPSSGVSVTTSLVSSVVATPGDPVTVSGRLLRPISVTVVLPSDPPDNWAYQLVGYVGGDLESSPVLATGALSRDVATDPVPAGDDGIVSAHTFGNEEPTELQNIVIYAVAGLIMPRPVPRGQTPGPPEFVANNIVPGITASDDVTIGTTTGVLDPTDVIQDKLNSTLKVLGDVFGVPPLGISNPFVDALAIATTNIQDAAIALAKLAALSVDTSKIIDLAVNTPKMADLAATAAKLASSSVIASKIDNLAVGTAAMAAAAITTAKVANLAVTTGLIDNLQVSTAKIQTLAITSALILNQAVGTSQIGNLAVATAHIQDLAVTDAKINTLSVSKLLAGTITAAISMTSPTLVITAGFTTINIDGANFLKVSNSSSGISTQMISNEFKITASSVQTVSLTSVSGGQLTMWNTSGSSVLVAGASGTDGRLFINSAGSNRITLTVVGGIGRIGINGAQVLRDPQADPGVPTGWADGAAQAWCSSLRTSLRNHGMI